ncbi:MAG: glycerophosphodiester phosphodiesterase, partial [Gammaproteobacteria bacterium]
MNHLNRPLSEPKLVIAHRGASGYLPEHSSSAKAMAYAMGADYIEQDVVMTKDDQLVVLHDPFLDRVT